MDCKELGSKENGGHAPRATVLEGEKAVLALETGKSRNGVELGENAEVLLILQAGPE